MNASDQESFARGTAPARIATLNDQLRQTARGGQVVVTRGVTALTGFDPAQLMAALAAFDCFDEANDPYGEHDFGGVDLWGAELLWKIDYYDTDLTSASPDPEDECVTTRVLTVMLANEY